MNDWSRLPSIERFSKIVVPIIMHSGRVPSRIRISKKLFAELWDDGYIGYEEVETRRNYIDVKYYYTCRSIRLEVV